MSLSTPRLTTPSETCAQAVPQPRMQAATAKPSIRFMRFLLGDGPTSTPISAAKVHTVGFESSVLDWIGIRAIRTRIRHYSTPHSGFQSVRKLLTIYARTIDAGRVAASDLKARFGRNRHARGPEPCGYRYRRGCHAPSRQDPTGSGGYPF